MAEVVPFDADAFSSAMKRLLTDPETYERYKNNCQAMVKDRFSIESVVDRLEVVYERVIEERKGR